MTAYRIRPGGAVVRIGKPVLDLSGGGVEWQVADDVLWVLTTDARSRTLMAKLDLPSGRSVGSGPRQKVTTGPSWTRPSTVR